MIFIKSKHDTKWRPCALTRVVSESHVKDVTDVNVLVERFFDEILRFVTGQVSNTSVEEDEPKIQRGAEHEHVGMQFQFGNIRRWQRMTNGD